MSKHFTITPAQLEDAEVLGEVHLESWLQTYPNEELGIDEKWIRETFTKIVSEDGNEFRRNTIKESYQPNSRILYLVVRDKQGKARGFLHASRADGDNPARLDAIYLTDDVKGTGVAQELMKKALEFVGEQTMELQCATYNPRAINFYEKYGFVKQPGTIVKHRAKIPVMTMIRPSKPANKDDEA